MKRLKNKETGKVGELIVVETSYMVRTRDEETGLTELTGYNRLADVLNHWEDAPEEINSIYPINPWDETVMIKELPSGLRIADIDYYEFDEDGKLKTEFTWYEAMEIEKKTNGRWRVPTPKELNQIALDIGCNDEGIFDGELLADNLGVREKFDEFGYMEYWSRALYSGTYSRALYFYSARLYPTGYSNRGSGFAVRCVASES